jgi:hypothetical protein
MNRSHAAYVDVDFADLRGNPTVPEAPALEPGPLGCFDDHGVYPTSVVADGERVLLFYAGFSPGRVEPLFYASIGVAESHDGGRTFERIKAAPVLARNDADPCLVTAPCVIRDGGRWRMWYVSGYRWDTGPAGPRSWYRIAHAESADGISWRPDGVVCIDHGHPGERNISRPCVRREGDIYRAWYAFAGDYPYRLGYAESKDGYIWDRADDAVILTGEAQDWERRSCAYPWVTDFGDGRRAMLYCGDDLGRRGFGLALEEPPEA